MVFLLKKVKGHGLYHLISGKEYVIGRKNSDIILKGDQSISKKHAIIRIDANVVTLMDCKSTHGTTRNNTELAPDTTINLENNDVIKFGKLGSVYKLEKLSLITTGSGLTAEQKNELKAKMARISGSLINYWDDTCTHLTAQEILLTIKVLHALIDDKPIVTLAYWEKFIANITQMKPPPNIEDYRPPVAEALINRIQLSPNPVRKSLFKNKTFIFPTEKIKAKMFDLIEKTGGTSISWEKEPLSLLEVTKSKNKYLFIISEDTKVISQSLKDIHEHLTKLGERTIPIQEIAMAIVLCSCEKDCNPKFNRLHNVFMEQTLDTQSENSPLAFETQSQNGSQNQSLQPKQEMIIPESLDADVQMLSTPKPKEQPSPEHTFAVPSTSSGVLKRVEKEPSGTPSKRMKLDEAVLKQPSITFDSKKRKADENAGPTPKKSSLRENPFASFKNKTASRKTAPDNPFAGLRVKKEITPDNDNPFKKIVKQQSEERRTPEVLETSLQSPPLSFSQSYCPVDISNITWLSKREIKSEEVEIEPEFKEIFEKFKNTVVIEVLPRSAMRVLPPNRFEVTLNGTTTGKNFKKFKKVPPRKPQISITSTTVLQTNSNEITILSDGEEEHEVRRPVVKKSKSKRFNF